MECGLAGNQVGVFKNVPSFFKESFIELAGWIAIAPNLVFVKKNFAAEFQSEPSQMKNYAVGEDKKKYHNPH